MKRTAPMPPRVKPLSGILRTANLPEKAAISKSPRKTLKSRKVQPTAAERAWMGSVAELGCIVCLLCHHIKTPCAVHHIVEGGRRLGHMSTIGLCDPGHHQNTPDQGLKISRHPTKAQFESAYGTEYELLEQTQRILKRKGLMP